jgi:hypothetical protein
MHPKNISPAGAAYRSLCTAVLAFFLLTACGGKRENATPPSGGVPPPESAAVPAPAARPVSPQFLEAMKGVDISALTDIEKEIFDRTVRIQIPFYQRLTVWADSADRIMDGEHAASALRAYLRLQEEFGAAMGQLDKDIAGRVPADFEGSVAFNKAVDDYLARADMVRVTERITRSFTSLIARYRDNPACRNVMARIDRMSKSPQ